MDNHIDFNLLWFIHLLINYKYTLFHLFFITIDISINIFIHLHFISLYYYLFKYVWINMF